jgi:hypothetical protein
MKSNRDIPLLLFSVFFLVYFCLPLFAQKEDSEVIEVGAFSKMTGFKSLPKEWIEVRFQDVKRPTYYLLAENGGTRVVKAISQASASGIGRALHIRTEEYPILQWRWKVENLIQKSDLYRKSGDDYSARIYVAFDHDETPLGFFEKILFKILRVIYGRPIPARALNYLWSKNAPVGTEVWNPYTKRVRMIVVQTGSEGLNQWHEFERNIDEDYKRAFGKEPPPVRGIGMMTDTDNTGETTVAYYGDILLRKKP